MRVTVAAAFRRPVKVSDSESDLKLLAEFDLESESLARRDHRDRRS